MENPALILRIFRKQWEKQERKQRGQVGGKKNPNQIFFRTIPTYLTFWKKNCLGVIAIDTGNCNLETIHLKKYEHHVNVIYIYFIIPNNMINSVIDLHAP